MRVKIAKWGNSLAVRLPKRFADDLGLTAGKTVDLQKKGNKLSIETASPKVPVYALEELLAQIRPGQQSSRLEDGGILPSEWPGGRLERHCAER